MEPKVTIITTADQRALRNADSIVFRLLDGQARISCYRNADSTASGFEEVRVIYAGGASVRDNDADAARDGHAYNASVMWYQGTRYDDAKASIVRRIATGGTVALHWTRNNSSQALEAAGVVRDELRIVITGPTPDKLAQRRAPRRETYLVAVQVGPDNTARMVRWDASRANASA